MVYSPESFRDCKLRSMSMYQKAIAYIYTYVYCIWVWEWEWIVEWASYNSYFLILHVFLVTI